MMFRLLLLLTAAFYCAAGGGLRGVLRPRAAGGLVPPLASPNSNMIDATLMSILPFHQQMQHAPETGLTCQRPNSFDQQHCPNGNQHPVCHYNQDTQDYETHCIDSNVQTGESFLHNPHPKSYCGVCHACFETLDELQSAVDSYMIANANSSSPVAQKYGYPMNDWCVDRVTDFSHLFFKMSKFNEDISAWDTSEATDMTSMFQNAYSFNQDISQWNTSNVRSMERMFAMAVHFNQDLGGWDVSLVEHMGYMFIHCLEFNQDLNLWDVRGVADMNSMFFGATNFHRDLLKNWEIGEHTDTENMCEWSQEGGAPQ